MRDGKRLRPHQLVDRHHSRSNNEITSRRDPVNYINYVSGGKRTWRAAGGTAGRACWWRVRTASPAAGGSSTADRTATATTSRASATTRNASASAPAPKRGPRRVPVRATACRSSLDSELMSSLLQVQSSYRPTWDSTASTVRAAVQCRVSRSVR